jgi:IS1 family transposase
LRNCQKNNLRAEKQETIIGALVESSSIRSVERMTGVHRDTIMRFAVRIGNSCEKILDSTMHGLTCQNVEVDEIWSFVGKKQRHVGLNDNPLRVGDFCTFVDLDSDTKLIPAYRVGKRDLPTAQAFIDDLASRLTNRIQLSVERSDLTVRMQIRRFTCLTNAFSKKLENLKAAVSLHFAHYNFVRIHRTLRVTPAMEAGLTSRIWKGKDLIEMAI